jgi:hypothetical protein
MKTLILIFILLMSCEGLMDKTPSGFENLQRPITIVACNEQGMILMDADGVVVTYSKDLWFTTIMQREGCKKGDVIE